MIKKKLKNRNNIQYNDIEYIEDIDFNKHHIGIVSEGNRYILLIYYKKEDSTFLTASGYLCPASLEHFMKESEEVYCFWSRTDALKWLVETD